MLNLAGNQRAESLADDVMFGADAEAPPPAISKTATRHARKRHYGLQGCVVLTTIMAILLMLLLFVYYAIVFLNFTFVFDPPFAHDDVPFYRKPNSDVGWKQADRYGVWWWLIATSLFRVVSVIGTQFAVTNAAMHGEEAPLVAMQIWTIVYGLFDVSLAVFYIVVVYSNLCASVQFCRNWEATQSIELASDGNANWIFLGMAWFSLAFAAVHIVNYIVLQSSIRRVEVIKTAIGIDNDMKDV